MKKVKTLLVTAVAALSLSACTFQDITDWTKNAGGQVGGFFTSLLEKLGIKQKGEKKEDEPCTHEDKNHDGTCDLCGVTGLQVVHADENHDHNCDVCGVALSEHADENNDFVCDICGKEFAITGVELDTSDVQLLFAKDDEFNSDGLKIIATSEFGNQRELEFTVSSPDMSTVGDKEVEVTYGEGENDKLSYTINVSYWSEDDLEVLESATMLGYFGGTPLPYLPGFNMRVEIDESGESWRVVADDITVDAYLDLYNAFGDINVVTDEGLQVEVTFAFAEVAGDFEGFHGLSDVSVFRLSPLYNDDGYDSRYFVQDEYYVMGINGQGQLIIETRLINAMLDGFFFGDVVADGYYGFPAQYNAYVSYLPQILGYYFSEVAVDAFPIPTLATTASFVPMNLASMYPLSEGLDAYDLAWMIEFDEAEEKNYTDYCAALLAAGYEQITDPTSGTVSYLLENDFVGSMEFIPAFYPEYGNAFVIEFYYVAPEDFITRLHPAVYELMDALKIEEFEVDGDYYDAYGELDVWFVLNAPAATDTQTSEEQVCNSLVNALVNQGYEVEEGPELGSYYGIADAWVATLTDYATLNVTMYVFEASDGVCEITFEITKFYSFTIEDVISAIFGDVTPSYADGVYSAVMLPYEEGETPSTAGMGTIILAASDAIEDIADIDYNILNGGSYYYFSALTKDGKIIFTVYAYPGQDGYTLDHEVEELGEKEALMRSTLDLFSSLGPVRYGNYDLGLDGSVTTDLKFTTGLEDTLVEYIYNYVLPADFEFVDADEVEVEGVTKDVYLFSNGTIDYTVTVYDDGTNTNVNIVISDANGN